MHLPYGVIGVGLLMQYIKHECLSQARLKLPSQSVFSAQNADSTTKRQYHMKSRTCDSAIFKFALVCVW